MRRLGRKLGLLTAGALILPLLVSVAPAASGVTSECYTPSSTACPPRVRLGISDADLPQSTATLQAFTNSVGRDPWIAMYFQDWENGMDTTSLTSLIRGGHLPMITWEPYNHLVPKTNTFPLANIANGSYDAYINEQARRVASLPGQVAIRFGHEMNGYWYPWGQPDPTPGSSAASGNTPAKFVAAYKHVHDRFVAEGATNVTWIWAPNLNDATPGVSLKTLYPGDSYVNWVGLSVYFDKADQTWDTRTGDTFKQLDQVTTSKPLIVAEGSVLPGVNRAAQITDYLRGVLATPRMTALVWLNNDARNVGRYDWRVTNDRIGASAFNAAASSDWFATLNDNPGPGPLNPLPQGVTVAGVPQVGTTMSASAKWRYDTTNGTLGETLTWNRCLSPTDTQSCSPVASGYDYIPQVADLGNFLRVQASGTTGDGTGTQWSPALRDRDSTYLAPSVPATPRLDARPTAIQFTLPKPQQGVTYWVLKITGRAAITIPTATKVYWVSRLKDGTRYTWALQAGSGPRLSSARGGTMSSMAMPGKMRATFIPTGTKMLFPAPPKGATGWKLVVNGKTYNVKVATKSLLIRGLKHRTKYRWYLNAVAGNAISNTASSSFTTPK